MQEQTLSWVSRLARLSMLWVAVGAVGGILVVGNWLWVLIFLPSGVLLIWQKRWIAIGALIVIGTLFYGIHKSRIDATKALSNRLYEGDWNQLEGRIGEEWGKGRFVQVSEVGWRVKVLVFGLDDDFFAGERIRFSGEVLRPRQVRNPGVSSLDVSKGVAGWVRVTRVENLGCSGVMGCFLTRAERLKNRFSETLSAEQGGVGVEVVKGVVLGERTADMRVKTAFRRSGTMHVFAVSGLHVGLVGAMVWLLLKPFRVPWRWAWVVVIVAMFGYAFITGFRPPAARAVLLGTVVGMGFLLRRKVSLMNSLAATMLIVLGWDSFDLFHPGFQLSYGVTMTILVSCPYFLKCFSKWVEPDPLIPKTLLSKAALWGWSGRRYVVGLCGVSLTAWLAATPLTAVHFGFVALVGVVATVLVLPLIWMVLGVGLLASLIGLGFEPAGRGIAKVDQKLGGVVFQMVEFFSEIPGGFLVIPTSTESDTGEIVVFDLGAGGSCYLDWGGGILVDVGGARSVWSDVIPSLRGMGKRVDSVVITHADSAHCGGFSTVLNQFEVRQILVPERVAQSRSYQKMMQPRLGVPIILAERGRVLDWGERGWLDVLRIPKEVAGRADDRGLVLKGMRNGWSFLWMGDAGFATEMELVESGLDLRTDVLILGQNVREVTGSDAFLRRVSPRIVIVTGANYPERQMPSKEWQERVREMGAELYILSETGGIRFSPKRGELKVIPYFTSKKEKAVIFKKPC